MRISRTPNFSASFEIDAHRAPGLVHPVEEQCALFRGHITEPDIDQLGLVNAVWVRVVIEVVGVPFYGEGVGSSAWDGFLV